MILSLGQTILKLPSTEINCLLCGVPLRIRQSVRPGSQHQISVTNEFVVFDGDHSQPNAPNDSKNVRDRVD